MVNLVVYWLNLSINNFGLLKLLIQILMMLVMCVKLQLNEPEKLRNDVYENSRIIKAKTKVFHDKSIFRKTFEIDQKMLFYNSHVNLF